MSVALNQYGLKYEDCLIEHPPVKEALSYMSQSALLDRDRRIKRAMDLSFKKKTIEEYYGKEYVAALEPTKLEWTDMVDKIKARDEERELLNKGW